jgi:hypothetical protein
MSRIPSQANVGRRGSFIRQMAGEDRLLSTADPGVGRVSRDPVWGRTGPMADGYANRGHKRTFSSNAGGTRNAFKQMMSSVDRDAPASRMTHDMEENGWATVKRKIAFNRELFSQNSKIIQYPIWTHPAVDEYDAETDYDRNGTEKYRRGFVTDTYSGTRVIPEGKEISGDTVLGGSTAFLYFQISLAEMNSLLQESEPAIDDPTIEDPPFEDAVGDWKLNGVLEVVKSNEDKYGRPLYTGDDAHTTSVIYGYTYIINYWGNQARKGTKLYFIAKRVDRENDSIIPIENKSSGPYIMGVNKENSERWGLTNKQAKDNGIVKRPFQIIPWAKSGMEHPSLEDREYIDNNGMKRYGSVMYVGRVVESSGKKMYQHDLDNAPHDDVAAGKLSRIWIFYGV